MTELKSVGTQTPAPHQEIPVSNEGFTNQISPQRIESPRIPESKVNCMRKPGLNPIEVANAFRPTKRPAEVHQAALNYAYAQASKNPRNI